MSPPRRPSQPCSSADVALARVSAEILQTIVSCDVFSSIGDDRQGDFVELSSDTFSRRLSTRVCRPVVCKRLFYKSNTMPAPPEPVRDGIRPQFARPIVVVVEIDAAALCPDRVFACVDA